MMKKSHTMVHKIQTIVKYNTGYFNIQFIIIEDTSLPEYNHASILSLQTIDMKTPYKQTNKRETKRKD